MRILIDMQAIQCGSRYGGIGRYTYNLISELLKKNNFFDIHLLLNPLFLNNQEEVLSDINRLVIKKENIHFFYAFGNVLQNNKNNLPRARINEFLREHFIKLLQPDCILMTSLIEGFGDNAITSVKKFYNIPTAAILYDLIPLVEQKLYLTTDGAKAHYLGKIKELKKCDLLLSISEFSRNEALELLSISDDKISNISSAIDKKFTKINLSLEEKITIKKKYGIFNEFILYTSSFDQRKNHEKLIKAFSLLAPNLIATQQLVIVGNGWNEIYTHLKWLAGEYGLSSDRIVFTGKIIDEDLIKLYNLCNLFVFPSLREGFGLPVLEAMSCGASVIGSMTTSIPEVIGNESALFNPNEPTEIAKKIEEIICNDHLKLNLVKTGLKRSKLFSWEGSALKAILALEKNFKYQSKLYELNSNLDHNVSFLIDQVSNIPEAKCLSENDLMDLSKIINVLISSFKYPNNIKIGIISTWDTKCGIASYSKNLISNFIENVIILAPYNDDSENYQTKNIYRCWKLGDDNLKQLFNIIIEKELKYISIQFNYGFFEFNDFNKFLIALNEKNIKYTITLHSTTDPDPLLYRDKKLSILKEGLAGSKKILVHSKAEVSNFDKLELNKSVSFFPQGVFSSYINRFCDKKEFIISTYGYFLPHKGLLEVIQAFATLNETKTNLRLLMLNCEYDVSISSDLIEQAHNLIKNLGLNKKVELYTNYFDDEITLKILESSNLVVFAYQETGESSSAAVKMGLSSGVPVAVTPLKIFNDVDHLVHFLPGTNVESIKNGLNVLINMIENEADDIKIKREKTSKWYNENNFGVLSARFKTLLTK